MNYVWRLWIGFTFVLAVLLTATAVLSLTALRLDRAEADAIEQAAIEERVRLALWRMDSALAPLLAQENAHPHYRSDPPSLMPALDLRGRVPGDRAQPMPLGGDDQYVLLRFQYPVDSATDQADDLPTNSPSESPLPQQPVNSEPSADPSHADGSLEHLSSRIPRQRLVEKLPRAPTASAPPLQIHLPVASPQRFGGRPDSTVASRAEVEFQQRSQSLMNNSMVAQQLSNGEDAGTDLAAAMMIPVWTSGEMFLARRVQRNGSEHVEGCLIDWRSMQQWLIEMVADLLPEAQLEPVDAFDPAGEPGLLAALPARLLPGPLPAEVPQRQSAVPQTLALAWFAVLLSSLVGAGLVVGVVRLSQRREAFVAAVTHELRTPLTTFRMYSEMLAQGMVRDIDAQREYLNTLRDQSLRLSHLVENVLAYARLERGRSLGSPEKISLSQLIDPILPSLEQRAASEQMELVVERTAAFDVPVYTNPSAVQQILVNLIDNACKYAGGTADRRICLSAHKEGRYAVLRVRDHGPGLPHQMKWFRPFSKSVQEAAHSAPGIGLGLALSGRLAKQMGARLQIDRATTDGAALLLRLPTRKTS